jgi:hypothetical protein
MDGENNINGTTHDNSFVQDRRTAENKQQQQKRQKYILHHSFHSEPTKQCETKTRQEK